MISLTRSQAHITLLWVRFLIGGISWFFPEIMASLMQIDSKKNPAFSYGLRLFGVRDLLMGLLIRAPKGEMLDQQVSIGIAIDLIDVTASGMAGFTGQISKRAMFVCCGAGLIGASLGAASLGKGPLAKGVREI